MFPCVLDCLFGLFLLHFPSPAVIVKNLEFELLWFLAQDRDLGWCGAPQLRVGELMDPAWQLKWTNLRLHLALLPQNVKVGVRERGERLYPLVRVQDDHLPQEIQRARFVVCESRVTIACRVKLPIGENRALSIKQ